MPCPTPTLHALLDGRCCATAAPAPAAPVPVDRARLVAFLADYPPDALLRAVRAERARRSLYEFFRQGWHVLEPSVPLVEGQHLKLVCDHVQAVLEDWAHHQEDPTFVQRVRDALVSIGPGTAKSRVGVYAIPWIWLRWPALRAICMSANPRVARRDSMLAREVIASEWYQKSFAPTWEIRDDADGKERFINTAGGFRSAMGMDARIVGERADLLWVDDPHDPEEANSEAKRTAVLDRWDTSISNRVNDLGSSVRIGIAQRVHEADWSAARIAEGWCELRLPLEFEADRRCVTPIGADWRTVEGECLHPARFTPEVIAAEKAKGGARWSALYQQRPTPAGGAMVKLSYLRFWRRPDAPDASSMRPRGCWTAPARELPPRFDAVCVAADLAAGKKTKAGDYNVIVAVGRFEASFYLLETWRDRADFPEVQRRFRGFAERYPLARKVIEAAAAGPSVVSSLEREIPGLLGLPAQGSKQDRMNATLQYFQAANVYFPEDWTDLEACVDELTTFPLARHDDFPDALNLAILELVGGATAWMATFAKAWG